MITLEGLLDAYFSCRRNKRKTANSIEFEMNYESNLLLLKDEINNETYEPSKSICFVVTRPRYREVFAATFRDRIIHHWIAIRLEPLFEEIFTDRTFNCRKGKGQLYGINMLKSDIKKCSDGYTKDCYIMKLDLSGFFMSIDKNMLATMLDDFILKNYRGDDIGTLRFLTRTVILHHPENSCIRRSPVEMWKHLPPNKSLFTNDENRGVAIGNLFSQIFANFLLNILDWFIIKELGFIHTGRYVDDFYIIDRNKQKLLSSIPKIRNKLDSLGLKLNPKKFYLQHYSKGVEFIGFFVKFDRVYINKRTAYSLKKSIIKLNNSKSFSEVKKNVASVNSYLGMLSHCMNYGIRRECLSLLNSRIYKYVYIQGRFKYISIKNKYKKKNLIME